MTTLELTQVKPTGTFDQIWNMNCVFDPAARQKNIDYAISKKIPWCVKRVPNNDSVAIVASGPSATDYVDLLKEWPGEIWGINGAFVWMMHRGIKPTAFVGLDPEPFLKDYLTETPDVSYYLAAQCHPEVYDRLAGKNVRIWFAADSQVKFPWGAIPVYGGSTCLGRAPNLAYLLGHREVHIFGCDSSFTHKSHVYGDGLPEGTFVTELGGKQFITTTQMLQQACEFCEQMVEWARPGDDGDVALSVSLYGDGLLQFMFSEQLASGTYQQYLREVYASGMTRKQRRAVRAA